MSEILTKIKMNFYFHPSKNLCQKHKFEDIFVKDSNNFVLHGWLNKNTKSNKIILISHGNAGNVSNRTHLLDMFYNMGFSSLVYDYYGFGKSEGTIQRE